MSAVTAPTRSLPDVGVDQTMSKRPRLGDEGAMVGAAIAELQRGVSTLRAAKSADPRVLERHRNELLTHAQQVRELLM